MKLSLVQLKLLYAACHLLLGNALLNNREKDAHETQHLMQALISEIHYREQYGEL